VGDFAVNDICTKYFNGGGHVNAAGGEFYGTLDQAVATFEQLLLELFPNVPVNNETATNNEI
jgi:phosphoesterase RecJ-like protein